MMPSTIERVLFGEPAGRPNSLVQFTAAVVFLALYAWSVATGTSGDWLLVMTAATTLSGVAESLPNDRRRTAGLLRLAAALSLVCLLAVIAVDPEFVTG